MAATKRPFPVLGPEVARRLTVDEMEVVLTTGTQRVGRILQEALQVIGVKPPHASDERAFHALSHDLGEELALEPPLLAAAKAYWALLKGMRFQPPRRHPDPEYWFGAYARFCQTVCHEIGRSSVAAQLGFPSAETELEAQKADVWNLTRMQ